jgi:phosphoenolpyruvate-protein phosphotransferase
LLAFDDEYMKERATDFGEVRRRLLDVMANLSPSLQCDERACQKGKNRIIVAEELTPTLTLELDSERVMGFMVERGGPSSHAAILARAMGIPAISGLIGIRDRVSCGAEVLLNGDIGEVVLWPSESTIRQVCGTVSSVTRMPKAVPAVPGVEVLANINLAGEVDEANAMLAEGVGLYRTEFELISAGRALAEDELADRYRRVVQAMAGRPVTFRILDVGSDKPLPFLSLPPEENPALGLRGLRLLRERPDLFRPQARALARASAHGPVDILYPMIVDLDQFREAKRLFLDAAGDLPMGRVNHGVMFEVPSACLAASEILAEADFASIGTNDLFQYLFALDRNNSLVARDYRPDHPVFWRLMGSVAEAGLAQGKSVSLCGEIASEPAFLDRILAAGIRRVSLAPKRIPAVRAAAQQALAALAGGIPEG